MQISPRFVNGRRASGRAASRRLGPAGELNADACNRSALVALQVPPRCPHRSGDPRGITFADPFTDTPGWCAHGHFPFQPYKETGSVWQDQWISAAGTVGRLRLALSLSLPPQREEPPRVLFSSRLWRRVKNTTTGHNRESVLNAIWGSGRSSALALPQRVQIVLFTFVLVVLFSAPSDDRQGVARAAGSTGQLRLEGAGCGGGCGAAWGLLRRPQGGASLRPAFAGCHFAIQRRRRLHPTETPAPAGCAAAGPEAGLRRAAEGLWNPPPCCPQPRFAGHPAVLDPTGGCPELPQRLLRLLNLRLGLREAPAGNPPTTRPRPFADHPAAEPLAAAGCRGLLWLLDLGRRRGAACWNRPCCGATFAGRPAAGQLAAAA